MGLERGDGALSPQSARSQSRLTAYKLGQNPAKFIAVSTTEPHFTSDCYVLALHPSGFEICFNPYILHYFLLSRIHRGMAVIRIRFFIRRFSCIDRQMSGWFGQLRQFEVEILQPRTVHMTGYQF